MWTLFAIFAAMVGLLVVSAFIAALLRTSSAPPSKKPVPAAREEPSAPHIAPTPIEWSRDEPTEPPSIEPARNQPSLPRIEMQLIEVLRQEPPEPPPIEPVRNQPSFPRVEMQLIELLRKESVEPLSIEPTSKQPSLPRIEMQPVELLCEEPLEPARRELKELTIELIPYSMNYKNARAVLTVDAWCLLRYLCMKSDGAQCSECGSMDKEDLECHEVWKYLSLTRQGCENPVHIMKLVKMRMLCHLCHMGKHLGFARKSPDEYSKVRAHLLRVYGLSELELDEREHAAFEQVKELDKCGVRELDLTYLNDDRFQFVRYRSRRKLFSTNEVANCREPEASEDLAS
jgi:hypothetical protein